MARGDWLLSSFHSDVARRTVSRDHIVEVTLYSLGRRAGRVSNNVAFLLRNLIAVGWDLDPSLSFHRINWLAIFLPGATSITSITLVLLSK